MPRTPVCIDDVKATVGAARIEKPKHPTRKGLTMDELRKTQPGLESVKHERHEKAAKRATCIDDVRSMVGVDKPKALPRADDDETEDDTGDDTPGAPPKSKGAKKHKKK